MQANKHLTNPLTENEERFCIAQSVGQIGVWEYNIQNQKIWASKEAFKIYGIDRESEYLSPDDIQNIVHPDDKDIFDLAQKVLFEGLSQYDLEYRIFRKKDSALRVLQSRAVLFFDEQNVPKKVIGTVQDITERKEMEQLLIRSQMELSLRNKIAHIFLTIPDEEIYGAVLDLLLTTFQSEIGLFAYIDENDQLVMSSFSEGVYEKCPFFIKDRVFHHKIFNDIWIESVMNKRSIYSNKPFAVPVGHIPIQRAIFIPIIHSNKLIGLFALANKKTDYVQGDQELLEMIAAHIAPILNARRQRDIEETHRKKMQEDLLIAKKNAENANMAKSRFLANMSHEIRTPINAIMGLAQLLRASQLNPEQRDYVETILTSSETLLSLINDILDISRIESGKMKLLIQSFDIREKIQQMMDLMGIKADEKHLELACLIHNNVPYKLAGDHIRLIQILMNLVSNAIKFTEAGNVFVEISVVSINDPDITIKCSVKDTGIGIPKEQIPFLFQVFFQGDDSVTRKFGGTGLGLTISKHLAELMNGHIDVTSEVGKGSEFCLTVNLKLSDDPITFPFSGESLHGINVLIVDGNFNSRYVIKTYLTSWACEVHESVTIQDALQKIILASHTDHPVHVLIIDSSLIKKEGKIFFEFIQNNFQDIKIILLTKSCFKECEILLDYLDSTICLTKPVGYYRLYECLGSVLNIFPKYQKNVLKSFELVKASQEKKVNILLVEDQITNQKVALGMLKNMGFTADVAFNGIEAVKALKATKYDLVFMDVQMPQMDGFEATRVIRTFNREIPIIAMTAHAMRGDRERCLEAGMNDYITKPIFPNELVRILGTYLNIKFEKKDNVIQESHQSKDIEVQNKQVEIFNRKEFFERLDHDEALCKEVVSLFPNSVAQEIKNLENALMENNAEAARIHAHTIKGMAANISAERMKQVGFEIEKFTKNRDISSAKALLNQLQEEKNLLLSVLKNFGLLENK